MSTSHGNHLDFSCCWGKVANTGCCCCKASFLKPRKGYFLTAMRGFRLRGLSPHANYTDRAADAGRRRGLPNKKFGNLWKPLWPILNAIPYLSRRMEEKKSISQAISLAPTQETGASARKRHSITLSSKMRARFFIVLSFFKICF